MKNLKYILLLIVTASMACNSSKSGRTPKVPKREVPIAINIKAQNNATINFVNTDYFALQLVQDLDQFQEVNFSLVGAEDNPEVVLNLDISSFTLWPRDERMVRRRVSRSVPVGTDAAGKPIYQTVTASVDIVQVQRRSNARFVTNLTVKGTPGLKFQRTFVPNYNYVHTYVDNVQGDPRALDPGVMTRGIEMEPLENDYLLILARQEMVRRISTELRKYYDAQAKPAQ
ncbi:hypothetical protein [Daejeonella lutea]|uniref:Uncharacterized protein n=1 Tax=Daejeonella lutea TaxID=572036 RepID=A0A1T5A8B2_9SPHI|nr:hypothetical protein [Daejeonella lutea]SKB31156.1 hypothetical protein SAMN05661099_0431 [Daejeonella lutea]